MDLLQRFQITDPNVAIAHCLAALDEGQEPPTERLIFPAGEFRTTKGTFLFDDQAAKDVMADWEEWTGGLPQKGSSDYEHDQTKELMPGHLKLDSSKYDLALRQGALWAVNIEWTELAAGIIRAGEKRFTSPWWLYTKADKRICRYINFGLVSLPATLGQKELMAASAGVQVPDSYGSCFAGYLEIEAALGGAVPHKKYGLDKSAHWDGDAARKHMREWASSDGSGAWDKVDKKKYALGFAYVKDKGEHESDYLLPHHDIKDGQLVTVWGGIKAAGNAVSGARTKVSIPEKDLPGVKAHLAAHYREFGKIAPWERRPSGAALFAELASEYPKDEQRDLEKEANLAADAEASEDADAAEAAHKDRTTVQSLIFEKDDFSEDEAKVWAKKHDFKAADVDETQDSYRLRQQDPKLFKKGSFRTIKLTDGVKAVIGHKKSENATMADHEKYKDPKFKIERHAYALRYMASTAMENMLTAVHLHSEVPQMAEAMELPKHTEHLAEHIAHCAYAMQHHLHGEADDDGDDGEHEDDDDGASRAAIAKLPTATREKVERALTACRAAKCGGLIQRASKAALANVGAAKWTKKALGDLRAVGTLTATVYGLTGEKTLVAAGAALAAMARDIPDLRSQAEKAQKEANTARADADQVKYDNMIATANTEGKVLKGADEDWVRANIKGTEALAGYLRGKRSPVIASNVEQGDPGKASPQALASQTDEQRKAIIEQTEVPAEQLAGWARTGGGVDRLSKMKEAQAKKLGLIK
jgi:hypothetical protein